MPSEQNSRSNLVLKLSPRFPAALPLHRFLRHCSPHHSRSGDFSAAPFSAPLPSHAMRAEANLRIRPIRLV